MQTLCVVVHHGVGLLLPISVFQFDVSFKEPLHVFYSHVLVKLAKQLLKRISQISKM